MALPKLTTPKYELVIPSTQETVEYRPYTVKEEKILLLARESKDPKQIIRATRDLISTCTYGAIDVNTLTMFDFEYLFVQIRSKSVGETSDVRLTCTECNHVNEVTIDLSEAHVVGDVERDMKVMVTEDVGVVMRFPRFKAAELMSVKNENSASTYIELVISCIDSIFDMDDVYPADTQSKKELTEFVESLSAAQFKKIVEKIETLPTLELDTGFTCISCKKKNELNLKGLHSFF